MLVRSSCLLGLSSIPLSTAHGSFRVPKPFSGKFGDASDLTDFVTRPEIKAPLFKVTHAKLGSISPGYWFVAPYVSLVGTRLDEHYYQSCQIGPLIYDGAGELVWSGACLFGNQNTVDFRSFRAEDSDHLSMIFHSQSPYGVESSKAVIVGSSLEISLIYDFETESGSSLNMHEFNVMNDGKTVLHLTKRSIEREISGIQQDSTTAGTGRIVDNGFVEVDLATKSTLFEWWAADHIPLTHSSGEVSGLTQKAPHGWNWVHLNSVDKNEQGDYLISARYIDAIYKISGEDGHVIWTLGGQGSSFTLQGGLSFSRQHDARFFSSTATDEVISFLDNAGDDHGSTSSASSGLLISLDTESMTAKVLSRWTRPGGETTKQRGNFQMLPNGNVFAGWSDNSHISEHSADGEVLMDARWISERFATYRAWKANFTSAPAESPAIKSFMYGTTGDDAVLASYVSWNGATEVAQWHFYGTRPDGKQILLGKKAKTGFETLLQAKGCHTEVFAQAVSRDAQVLGKSASIAVLDADKICSRKETAPKDASSRFDFPLDHHATSAKLFWLAFLIAVLSYFWRSLRRRSRRQS